MRGGYSHVIHPVTYLLVNSRLNVGYKGWKDGENFSGKRFSWDFR